MSVLVLGIDPGTATTGYGLVKHEGIHEIVLRYGVIKTSPNMDMANRLVKINREYLDLLDEFQPDVVAIEELFHHKNAKTVISVAQSRGVLLMTAAAREIEIVEYTPLQVKQAVTGYGSADKKQVQTMVQKILALDYIPQPDDAADALAIAICHLHSYRLRNLSKGGNNS
jgi:crossover junction endodeoxyribonuclease RuvC